jgi:hypothetical protein
VRGSPSWLDDCRVVIEKPNIRTQSRPRHTSWNLTQRRSSCTDTLTPTAHPSLVLALADGGADHTFFRTLRSFLLERLHSATQTGQFCPLGGRHALRGSLAPSPSAPAPTLGRRFLSGPGPVRPRRYSRCWPEPVHHFCLIRRRRYPTLPLRHDTLRSQFPAN